MRKERMNERGDWMRKGMRVGDKEWERGRGREWGMEERMIEDTVGW